MSDFRRLIAIGVGLMLLGFIFPLLMVVKVIPSTFLLNFLSYGFQVSGLILGMIGIVFYVTANRRRP